MKQNTQIIDSPQIIHISTLFWGLVPNLNSLSEQTILNSRHVSQRAFTLKTIEGFIDFHSLRIKCLTLHNYNVRQANFLFPRDNDVFG